MNTFGERLKNLRIEKHMTQKQLAKKVGYNKYGGLLL